MTADPFAHIAEQDAAADAFTRDPQRRGEIAPARETGVQAVARMAARVDEIVRSRAACADCGRPTGVPCARWCPVGGTLHDDD